MNNNLLDQNIFNNSPYGLAVSTMSGVIIDANSVFSEIIGRTVDGMRELLYEGVSLKCSTSGFNRYVDPLVQTGKMGPVVDRYKHTNGQWVDVLVSATVLKNDDNNYLICWFVEDIRNDNDNVYSLPANYEYDLLLNAAQAKSILQTAVDAIITITNKGIINSFNPAAEKMFGYSLHEVLGNNIAMLLPEPHRTNHNSYINNYLKTGEAKIIGIGRETTAQRKDGSLFTVHLAVSETHIGDITLFTGIVRDISDLKKAQSELRINEERFRRSQKAANIGTWDWDLTTHQLFWSEQIPSLFGYPDGGLQAAYDNFVYTVHPEDRQDVIDSINECIYQREKFDIEHRCLCPDGTVKWMAERGDVILDSEGRPSHMLGVVQDITLRKKAEFALLESEERFRGAFEYATHGMAIVSMEGRWLKVNKSLEEMVGFSEQELKATTFKSVTHPDDIKNIETNLHQLIEGSRDYVQLEARYINKNGNIVWILFSATLVNDSSAQPLHFIYQVINISRRKQAESALNKAKNQAETANQAKSEFLSRMSHELRTPLNAILGFTELLEYGENLDDQQLRDLGEIKKASHHLLELINDVLDLTKIESRHEDITMDTIDLVDLIQQCCTMVHQQAVDRNITITNKIANNNTPSIFVRADQIRVKQIILNLLSNAIKYNREHGSIIISAQYSGDQQRVRLNIFDTGFGISPDKQTQLFQPFVRLGAEYSNIEGTGIGLVIAKHLTEKMNGNIGVFSTENSGTTFWIERDSVTPNADNVVSTSTNTEKNVSCNEVSVPYDGIANILIVEDNPTNCLLIRSQLDRLGYTTDIAATGRDAIELWIQNHYNAVLTDINLPDINGMELVARLKKTPSMNLPTTPFIAITANALAGDKEKFLVNGMDDYIAKPVELATLRNVLSKWLTSGSSISAPEIEGRFLPSSDGSGSDGCIFNLSALTRYVGDDPILQQKVLNHFLQSTPDILQRLETAYANRNSEELVMEAHKLKSSARTVGADQMGEICSILENTPAESNWDNFEKLITRLDMQFIKIREYVESMNICRPLLALRENK